MSKKNRKKNKNKATNVYADMSATRRAQTMPYNLSNVVLANLPLEDGAINGETVFVELTREGMELYRKDKTGVATGVLRSDSNIYSELKYGVAIDFLLAGENKPVAIFKDGVKSQPRFEEAEELLARVKQDNVYPQALLYQVRAKTPTEAKEHYASASVFQLPGLFLHPNATTDDVLAALGFTLAAQTACCPHHAPANN